MGFPPELLPLLGTRQFWVDYFGEGGSYPELNGCEIRLSPADGFALILRIDYDSLIHRSLSIETPGSERIQFAYNDDAHPDPWGLRWSELELISQVVSSADGGFGSPAPLVLLLQRFAPFMEGEDLSHISELAEWSWTSLGLFSTAEVQSWIDLVDTRFPVRRRRSVHADREGSRSELDRISDRPTRSFLHNRDPNRPEGRAVNRYLERVREEANVQGLDGLIVLAETDRAQIVGMRPRPRHRYQTNIPLNDPVRPLPSPAAQLISNTVDIVIANLFLGRCTSSGAAYDASGRQITDTSSLRLAGDRDHGLSVVAGIFRWFGVPDSASFVPFGPTDGTFELGEVNADDVVSHICLSQIDVVEIPALDSHAFRQRVITDDVLAATRSALENSAAAVTESNEEWRFDVSCTDGGELSIQCLRPEYNPMGVTVTTHVLTPESAGLIHTVADRSGLWIMPMMVAPNEAVAQSIMTEWPQTQTIDVNGLFQLLENGPP